VKQKTEPPTYAIGNSARGPEYACKITPQRDAYPSRALLGRAAGYIMKLPKAEQKLEEWQTATGCLICAAGGRDFLMHARIGVMRALNRSVVREFNPDREDHHWGAANSSEIRFVMDIYDEEDWTEMDIEDLKAAIEGGASIEQAQDLLCRADGVEEVARKCAELGLKPKAHS
jgi:hypothetical protein